MKSYEVIDFYLKNRQQLNNTQIVEKLGVKKSKVNKAIYTNNLKRSKIGNLTYDTYIKKQEVLAEKYKEISSELTYAQIAKVLGVSQPEVKTLIERYNLQKPGKRSRNTTNAETTKKIEYYLQNYQTKTSTDIARDLGISKQRLSQLRIHYNLPTSSRAYDALTDAEKLAISGYYDSNKVVKSMEKIAKDMNISGNTLNKILEHYRIKKDGPGDKLAINPDYTYKNRVTGNTIDKESFIKFYNKNKHKTNKENAEELGCSQMTLKRLIDLYYKGFIDIRESRQTFESMTIKLHTMLVEYSELCNNDISDALNISMHDVQILERRLASKSELDKKLLDKKLKTQTEIRFNQLCAYADARNKVTQTELTKVIGVSIPFIKTWLKKYPQYIAKFGSINLNAKTNEGLLNVK